MDEFPNKDLPEAIKKQRPRYFHRLNAALSKIAKRAVTAPPEAVREYAPREIDVAICEAQLSGARSFTETAEFIGCGPQTVSKALRDPVAAAWIWQQCQRAIAQKVGHVDTVVFQKAIAGDMNAAKLFYQRQGGIVNRSVNLNLNSDDLEKLKESDLDAIINSELAQGQGQVNPGPEGEAEEGV